MLGRYAEAESVRRQLLESQRHTLESGDPGILVSLLSLSELALAQNARERALQYWEEQRRTRASLLESTSFPPRQVNDYVFTMLTSPLCERRDAEEILPLAERSVEQTGAANPKFLDTLALAYWKSGKRAEATATQTKAVDLLPPGESNLRTELEERLFSFLQDSQNAEWPK
jgi:tetratricopeptide (TPR) repeat protein